MIKFSRKSKIRNGSPVVTAIWVVILLSLVLTCLFPFVYMLVVSMMSTPSMKVTFEAVIKSGLSLSNYVRVFKNYPFARNILNSVYVTIWTVFLICLLSSMAGYAFAKKKFPGRQFLFTLYLFMMMIPGQVTLIPKFLITKELGWINTFAGLIIPGVAGGGIILMHQFMKSSLPDALLESAEIDGCSEFGKYLRIVIPLIKPVIVTQAILSFIACWGDMLWPLLIATDRDMVTLTLAVSTLKEKNVTDFGPIMAGNVMAMLPTFIMYMFAQKSFVEGIALSGMKL